MSRKIKRRDFLKTSAAAAGASAALSQAPALGQVRGANDRIIVGVIGIGGQGRANLRNFLQQPEVELAAVCEVHPDSLARAARDRLLTAPFEKASKHKDFREILDHKDINAVIISTPDHWHALPTIMACQAGKDVYVEKPLALTIHEGRKMVEAARKHQRVIQVGTQQRSGVHFQQAVEIVHSGKLGQICHVRTWNFSNEEGIGNPPDSNPPPGLDWDLWLGPAPKVPYNKNRCLYTFRWFWDYSGGKLTDWGTHLIDIVQWAMNVHAPLTATAAGGKYVLKDNRETPDTLHVSYEYPGFLLTYETRTTNGRGLDGRGYGILFHGTDATLFVDRGGFEVIPETKREKDVNVARTLPLSRGTSEQSLAHIRNFLDCMKSRQRPNSDVEAAHYATATPHLGNIAFLTQRKLRWDAAREQIIGDAEANKMVSKPYRAPWKLA
jgi:predicted dehydrogenase